MKTRFERISLAFAYYSHLMYNREEISRLKFKFYLNIN